MSELRFLLQLAGEAALLLWGLHMVQSGVERAFGGRLQAVLGTALGTPWRAMLAGLGVTAALQSSTATALIASSLAATRSVGLQPALAAMLGANVGTALIVQVMSLDFGWMSPILILIGVAVFRNASRTRTRDLGRVAIGLGLMLLALQMLLETLAPVEASPTLGALLGLLAGHPLATLLLAAAIAWAAHSSVAGVLFVATLAGSGSIGAEAAIAMVLGANLGSALNPLLAVIGGADRARMRLPVGNLLNRLVGIGLVLAVLPDVTAWMTALDPSPVRLVANAHLAFNLATSLLALPLLMPLSAVLRRVLPDRGGLDEAAPRYLEPSGPGMPAVAIANAQREVLRLADMVERMLEASARAFASEDRDAAKAVAGMDDVVDRLHRTVLAYLAAIPEDRLAPGDVPRLEAVRDFAIAMEHAADVLSRDVARHATKCARLGVKLPGPDREDLDGLHDALRDHLRLAVAVFMVEDAEAARQLVRGKETLRSTEREVARRAALAAPRPLGDPGATPGFVLDAIRDLRRVGAHLATVGHPLLERRGELLSSRLARPAGASDD